MISYAKSFATRATPPSIIPTFQTQATWQHEDKTAPDTSHSPLTRLCLDHELLLGIGLALFPRHLVCGFVVALVRCLVKVKIRRCRVERGRNTGQKMYLTFKLLPTLAFSMCIVSEGENTLYCLPQHRTSNTTLNTRRRYTECNSPTHAHNLPGNGSESTTSCHIS